MYVTDAEREIVRQRLDAYWDRCADGEDPASVIIDFPELGRMHRNVSAMAAAQAKQSSELARLRRIEQAAREVRNEFPATRVWTFAEVALDAALKEGRSDG